MTRIVLAGAGHAHLYAIKRAAELRRRNIELVLIAPEPFWYSGLATGMLGGTYPPELDQVDVAALIVRGGGQSLCDRISSVDAKKKTILLESGASLAYDFLSLDLGSEPVSIPGANNRVYAVKPISNLWRLHCGVKELMASSQEARVQIVIVGGGPTTCEVAANLLKLRKLTNAPVDIVILTREARLLTKAPHKAAEIVTRVLANGGATIVSEADVRLIENNTVVTGDGRRFTFDLAVNATGLMPSPVMRRLGLSCDADGALIVDRYLKAVEDPSVFGGGDCVAFTGRALPKLGVYAVRQAPILLRNLIAAAEGRPLTPYKPQTRALAILNLGDGTGLAMRGRFAMRSRFFGWLKDRIDRAFLARYLTG